MKRKSSEEKHMTQQTVKTVLLNRTFSFLLEISIAVKNQKGGGREAYALFKERDTALSIPIFVKRVLKK